MFIIRCTSRIIGKDRLLKQSARTFSGYKRDIRKPTIEDAKNMPREFSEMSNHTLMQLGALGEHDATKERLRREIMAVDGLEWDDAGVKVYEIEKKNKEGMYLA